MRWLMMTVRGAVILIVALGMVTATATLLAGQQASDSVPQATAPVAPASSASTELPGPRLRPDFARVEPAFANSNASSSSAAVAGSHTITITTLALVLVVIIVVLLVAD